MANGINVGETAFTTLPQRQQLLVLYNNTEELKAMVSGYKFQQRIQWAAIGTLFLIAGAGRLFGII